MKIRRDAWLLLVAMILLLSLLLPFVGCGVTVGGADLMEKITPNGVQDRETDAVFSLAYAKFAASVLAGVSGETNGNLLVSPLSLLSALALTANGAKGETLRQMCDLFGLSSGDLNAYLHTYRKNLGENLTSADAIFFRDTEDFSVKKDFLQTNADYFGASAFASPFDEEAIAGINAWVKKKTNGRIDRIVDKIGVNTMMILLDALTFDGTWSEEFAETAAGIFTNADGQVRDVTMMASHEDLYVSDGKVAGTVKYYKGGRYAFVGLLPEQAVDLDAYLSSGALDFGELISSGERADVSLTMPKFKADFSIEMTKVLQALGMTDAFDDRADFSGMSDADLYIGSILQKTYISVDEKGTEAAAVTQVEMECKSVNPIGLRHFDVTLDRPFIYGIVDTDTGIPLFVGCMKDMK